MALAFRLYGHFAWPPAIGSADATKIATGVLELHIEPFGAGKRAALQWMPGEFLPDRPMSEPPAPEPIAGASALEHVRNRESDKWALWIDDAVDKGGLNFRGISLIEQYVEGKLDLRLPLANGVRYETPGVPSFSGLRLHKDGAAPVFTLSLHLPIPVAVSQRSQAHAFPITARYLAKPGAAQAVAPTIAKLFGGVAQGDEGIGGSLLRLQDHRVPASDFKLGHFNFSERGRKERPYGTQFVIYSEETDELGTYWPENRRCVVEDLLRPYGFQVPRLGWLQYSHDEPGDLSLRFVQADNAPISGLIYRARVKPRTNSPSAGKSDLIAKDEGLLALRLREELAGRTIDAELQAGHDDGRVEGWITLGSEISLDCELAWDIGDAARWSGDKTTAWHPTVTLRIHWTETVADLDAGPVEPDKSFAAGLLRHAAHSFQTTREALPAGEAGQPESFLPDLRLDGGPQVVRFCLYATPLPASIDEVLGLVAWGPLRKLRYKPTPGAPRPPLRLSLMAQGHAIAGTSEADDANTLALTARAITFFGFARPGPVVHLTLGHDESWPQTSVGNPSVADFMASFAIQTELERVPAWGGRLASLEFAALGNFKDDRLPPSGRVRIGGRGGGRSGGPLLYPQGRVAAELRLALPVTTVRSVGVDVPRFDRSGRAAPLLMPIASAEPANVAGGRNDPRYWLIATETLLPREDRRLLADIYDVGADQGERSYAVLSFEPFSIFRFTHEPLSDRARADSASVAAYSGDDRVWQYKTVSSLYYYSLPPQVIGESADKPRRLEIHDLPEGATPADAARPFVQEIADGPDGTTVLAASSDRRRRAVEYRLTPSAEIWVAPSDVERGYFMPEAASHEVFRQFGAYGIGAALAYMRAEFLYGLPVGVEVAKERAIARGARVAEIEALVGKPSGPARDIDAEPRLAHRWDALRAAVARRPERLEVWARDLDSQFAFTPVRFTDGARFALRGTALHRAPVIDGTATVPPNGPEGKEAHAAWPLVGGHEFSYETPEKTRAPALPRHHPQGLSGGALWPIESLNLFNVLLSAPESRGGAIERIAFSPTGGEATQKAEFLDGKVTIISETHNGRVQRQQVEVLGRIGALWHRAKHVVVYERTVNPSAQFAPKYDGDRDRTRSRRPILRKVREYIELLQPERAYPDFKAAAPRTTGFLERVRFNSRIINVDSSWASEVGNYGWKIALWNRGAARERPQVYPMPDIAFVTVAEGAGDKPVVSQECLDPDFLIFFADFKALTSDTDLWESRLSLDFANVPPAAELAKHADRKSEPGTPTPASAKADPRKPPVSRILPGSRRFTWRLAPAAQKTAINAGRIGKPVYVGLESVTFMRASHVEPEVVVSKPMNAIQEFKIDKLNGGALACLGFWRGDGQGGSAATEALSRAIGQGGSFARAIETAEEDQIRQAKAELEDLWTGLVTRVAEAAGGADFTAFAREPSGIGTSKLCQKFKDDAIGTVRRKEMLVRTALADWGGARDDELAKVENWLVTNKEDLIDDWTDLVIGHIRPLFEEASQDVVRIDEGIEKARAILLDTAAEIEDQFKRAAMRVDQFAAGYDAAKPWSPDRRKGYRAGIEACVRGIVADLEAAVDEGAQRLASELNAVCQPLAGHLAQGLRDVLQIQSRASAGIATLVHVVDDTVADIEGHLATLADAADPALGAIGALTAKVEANAEIAKPEHAALKADVLALLAKARNAVVGARQKCVAARARARETDEDIDQQLADFHTLIDNLVAFVTDVAGEVAAALAELAALGVALVEAGAEEIKAEIETTDRALGTKIAKLADTADERLASIGSAIDAVLAPTMRWLQDALSAVQTIVARIPARVAPIADDIRAGLKTVQEQLAPTGLLTTQIKPLVKRALERVLAPVAAERDLVADDVALIRRCLRKLEDEVGERMRAFETLVLEAGDEITKACQAVDEGIAETEQFLREIAGGVETYAQAQLAAAKQRFDEVYDEYLGNLGDVEKKHQLLAQIAGLEGSARKLHNDLARAFETASAYRDRVTDALSDVTHGGLMAAPSNVLKLYSAVTSAPEIAALKADIDRIRSTYDEINDVIGTTETKALFNRLGDELKALGLSIPFDGIGDRLLPANLANFDIGAVFKNFGGADLSSLFSGYRIPAGVAEAVKITHDFDKKQARAWVQVDIDAPFPGRRSLFTLGIFKVDFVDMRLGGQVRIEASKDEQVKITGYGRIDTALDVVVASQSMVTFEKFALAFTKEDGLDITFDPKNAKLNPQFKWIQDFLSTLYPELGGGLEWIKENGMPIGVQHDFVLPPMSLTFGTSGVSNLSLENHFKLLAYPDFVLANRFNLSTMERPFIFSVFIIGGTGYLQIEAEYNPIRNELSVLVEAAAGGSAQLAFAFGPFVGQVFITLSGVLSYRKLIGRSGGGLAISMVVVIAGHVQVAGIVTVGITLTLRLNYRENGEVDASGTLVVSIRISRFFTLTARAGITYRLRGGKSETTTSTSADAQLTDKDMEKLRQAQDAAKKLQKAVH